MTSYKNKTKTLTLTQDYQPAKSQILKKGKLETTPNNYQYIDFQKTGRSRVTRSEQRDKKGLLSINEISLGGLPTSTK